MNEIEVKILEVDRDALESKLIILGAEKIFEGDMFGVVFEDENNSLKKKNMLLRLRDEAGTFVFTLKLKQPSETVKFSEELECEVGDFDVMLKILEMLGFHVRHSLKKRRIEYEVDDVRFVFDKYEGEWSLVPEFLEIEAEDEDTLFRYAKLLGFSRDDCKPWSGMDVYRHYSKK